MDATEPVNNSSPPKEQEQVSEDSNMEQAIEEPVYDQELHTVVEGDQASVAAATEEAPTREDSSMEKEEEKPVPVIEKASAEETPLAGKKDAPAAMEDVQPTTEEDKDAAPPFLSAPASWQIPVAALHQQQQQQQSQHQKPIESVVSVVSNKSNMRKERFEARIKENKYDIEAWSALINDAQQIGDLEVIREIYERVLVVFPTSPKHWLAYLELELKYSNFNEVENLFTKCLKTVLSVDLWKFYLGYIRRINLGESGSTVTPEARAIIEKAYEYVLSNVGIDKDAGPIWADYIYFLKSAETSNTWEEQRKMDSMRRAYQKAVTIPLNNVEHLWKEYDQWENNLNRLTAKKFLGEKSSAYMTARTALREMRLFTDNINTNVVPLPPTWTPQELNQLELWKNYIQWEKGDPLQLEDEAAVLDRVAYTYQQAFLVLRFYPEIWYSFATYYQELNKLEKSLSILKQGIEILPTSLLLNFSYAELCESRKQLDDARQAFDSLVESLDKDIENLKQVSQQEIANLHQEAEEERASLNLSDDIDGELREQLRSREKHVKKEQEEIEARLNEQVEVIARASSLVWINYMRFARRTDGVKSCRALFSRARKATNCTYHVYVADALNEYHNMKDPNVAGKVFSLGQKSFADNPDYVCQYLDYLIERNDDNNTRALFERTLATMPTEKAGPVWLKFLDYENKYGDLASIQNVEKRRIEAIGNATLANPMESFLIRQSFLDIHNIQEQELGSLAREQHLAEQNAAAVANANILSNINVDSDRSNQPQLQQQQSQHEQQGKNREKRPLLEPVHPERYPRPDLNQWQAFKPTADANRNRPSAAASTANNMPNSPTVAAPIPDITKIEPIEQQQQLPIIPQQQQQQPVGNNWNNTGNVIPQQPQQHLSLPDAVAYFVSNLPPAIAFNGPMLKAGELVELLRNITIPLPPQGGSAPQPNRPLNQPNKPMQAGGPMRGGNYGSGNRGGGGGGNQRGGQFRRGGGGGGKKRRGGRDDYEEEFAPNKGMGPNRPPDFDLFRQRQAKRHRDDPPY